MVLVADAHEHYRSGLVRAIGMHRGLMLAAVVEDVLAALSLIISQPRDLALLDSASPTWTGSPSASDS